jgi:Fic family protein
MKTYQTYIWQRKEWPDFTYDLDVLQELLQKISYQYGLLEGISQSLQSDDLMQIRGETLALDAITTSEIEGELLTRDSVRSSINKKLGLEIPLRDHSTTQTDGLIDILLDATKNFENAIESERLFSWHAALFPTGYSGLVEINVAGYRGDDPMQIVSGPIGKEKIHYEAPPREGLEKEMEPFYRYLNAKSNENSYIMAAVSHLWFVAIHPFDDGNGRIARALTDWQLARTESRAERLYSMSAAINANRKGYYEILEQTTCGELDITAWIVWFLETLLDAQTNARGIIDIVLNKSKFWQRHRHTVLNLRQIKVLNRLLDSGQEGFEGGINSRKYASMTSCSRVTASRDLSELLEQGCIVKREGGGRSTSYEINW